MDHENPEEILDPNEQPEYELLDNPTEQEEEDVPQFPEETLYAYQYKGEWQRALRASTLKAMAKHQLLPLDTKIVEESKEKLSSGVLDLDLSQMSILDKLEDQNLEDFTLAYGGASPGKLVGTTKMFLGEVQKINGALEKWSSLAKQMQKAAEGSTEVTASLSTINQFLASTTFFSKLAPALGMLGAGLGIASGIIGLFGESANAVLFRALGQISTARQTI